MPTFTTLDQLSVEGKRVLVRVDLNVPMQDGSVSDDTRIVRLVPTIDRLAAAGAKVVLLSHFGRPKGKPAADLSLRPLVSALRQALGGKPVAFAEDCIGPAAERVVAALRPGGVALLENLRFHAGEEKNDPAFAKALASLGDAYVNEAFSAAHRAHASTEALAHLLPHAAGLLMQREIDALSAAFDQPKKPLAALVGGSKVSTKLDLLNSLVGRVDLLIVGGAMANTMLLARGAGMGRSLVEADMLDTARAIFEAAERSGCKLVLPVDAVVAPRLQAGVATEEVGIEHVPEEAMILDIGPRTVAVIAEQLEAMHTLVWNGPVGAFETPPFDRATVAIAHRVAALVKAGSLVAVAGGGDTVAALAHAGVVDEMSYVSTAGGAFLEWLEGRSLPGVKALES